MAWYTDGFVESIIDCAERFKAGRVIPDEYGEFTRNMGEALSKNNPLSPYTSKSLSDVYEVAKERWRTNSVNRMTIITSAQTTRKDVE